MHHLISNFIRIIIGLTILLVGCVTLLISFRSTFRIDFIYFVMSNSWLIFLIGTGFIVMGFLLLMTLYSNSKRYYQATSIKPLQISIDKAIFDKYLESYWTTLFPQVKIVQRLELKENKIVIIADLPYFPINSRDSLVAQIHQELTDILSRIIGYSGEFELSISFQNEAL